jgi:hypothetical protein
MRRAIFVEQTPMWVREDDFEKVDGTPNTCVTFVQQIWLAAWRARPMPRRQDQKKKKKSSMHAWRRKRARAPRFFAWQNIQNVTDNQVNPKG